MVSARKWNVGRARLDLPRAEHEGRWSSQPADTVPHPCLDPAGCLSQGVNCPRAEQQGRSPQPAQIQQHPCCEQQHPRGKGVQGTAGRKVQQSLLVVSQPVEGKRGPLVRLAGTGAIHPPHHQPPPSRRDRSPSNPGTLAQPWRWEVIIIHSHLYYAQRSKYNNRNAAAQPNMSDTCQVQKRLINLQQWKSSRVTGKCRRKIYNKT